MRNQRAIVIQLHVAYIKKLQFNYTSLIIVNLMIAKILLQLQRAAGRKKESFSASKNKDFKNRPILSHTVASDTLILQVGLLRNIAQTT